MEYSRSDVIENILRCEDKYGYVETSLLNNDSNLCSTSPIKREFGCLSNAREELDLTKIPKSPYNFEKEFGYLNVISNGYEKDATSYTYCIKFNDCVYYIGQSEKVRKRISKHYNEHPIRGNDRPPEVYNKYNSLTMTDIVEIRSFDKKNVYEEERKMFYDTAKRVDTKEVYGRR